MRKTSRGIVAALGAASVLLTPALANAAPNDPAGQQPAYTSSTASVSTQATTDADKALIAAAIAHAATASEKDATPAPAATTDPTPAPQPSATPTAEPSPSSSASPSADPTTAPSAQPSATPAPEPSITPTTAPTTDATASPSAEPSPSASPSETPAPAPNADPTPSASPTYDPAPKWDSFAKDKPEYPESAKQFDPDGDGKYVIPEPVQGGKGAGAVPAGLEKYYNQKIQWGKCDLPDLITDDNGKQYTANDGATVSPEGVKTTRIARNVECGYVIVPVDYSKPDGERMAVYVYHAAARDVNSDVSGDLSDPNRATNGLLFVNPGGPGGDSTTFANDLAWAGMRMLTQEVDGKVTYLDDPSNPYAPLSRFDIVGVAPRGTAHSMPSILCNSVETDRLADSLKLSPADYGDFTKFVHNDCVTQSVAQFPGMDGENYVNHAGVINTARDMDVVRAILGQEKLSYYGVSYGTRLGNQYRSLFENNIDRMLLDSSTNQLVNNYPLLKPYQDEAIAPAGYYDGGLAQHRAINQTFRHFLATCLTSGECALADNAKLDPKSVTPEQIQAVLDKYTELMRGAAKDSSYVAKAYEGRDFTFDDMTIGTIQAMYATSLWPKLQAALNALVVEKDPSGLLELGDRYYSRTWDPDKKKLVYDVDSSKPYRFQTLSCLDELAQKEAYSSSELSKLAYEAAPWRYSSPEAASGDGVEYPDYCAQWTASEKALSVVSQTVKPLATLVLGNAFDFATPFWQSVVHAKLNQGYLIISPNPTHGVYFDTKCAMNIVGRFLDVGPKQFDLDFANGLFKDAKYTGAQGVDTVDIYSKPTVATECQLISFRPANLFEPEGTPLIKLVPATKIQKKNNAPTPQQKAKPQEKKNSQGGHASAVKPNAPMAQHNAAPMAQQGGLAHTGANVATLAAVAALTMIVGGASVAMRRKEN
ncbi:pimeloyl-ACP methyl ester carboxylesterase [Arcanobacterium wilhelmae]|uniref:Pimeloyl-ACP methyl ester carboxylesterase n=1 Tax=Arcanobacterium wilhelmae TaxID=1803177 RepID=A0ABT9NB64_9ACTO|nr:alpha/beta fold hydrolase [Arcanobacterium wilhelmae]MDP9800745.1 pimeloyl-ACP methyl ester carboxylesterase [Arcanobacterium wilhelmae]